MTLSLQSGPGNRKFTLSLQVRNVVWGLEGFESTPCFVLAASQTDDWNVNFFAGILRGALAAWLLTRSPC